MRVELMKDFAKEHFPATPLLDYALSVEQVTTKKKNNLILNVDGCIGVCFVDLLQELELHRAEEIDEMIEMGFFNALFVLGRSIGFMGHYFDQNRLEQGLYRHPLDDILYDVSGRAAESLTPLLPVAEAGGNVPAGSRSRARRRVFPHRALGTPWRIVGAVAAPQPVCTPRPPRRRSRKPSGKR